MKATTTKEQQITIGLDMSDRKHVYCVPDGDGEVVKEDSVANRREALAAMGRSWPGATVVMEAGTHSPWVSRYLQGLGM